MTKAELAGLIAERTKVEQEDVEKVIESFTKIVKQTVRDNGEITIRKFGTFLSVLRKEKVGRDISKGTKIIIPERYVPMFRPSEIYFNLSKKK